MTFRFALAALATMLAPVAASAGSPACADAFRDYAGTRSPTVAVSIKDAPVEYDFSRSSSEIAQLGGAAALGGIPRGLTVSNFVNDTRVSFVGVRVAGGYCLTPMRADIGLGFDRMTVYIERKYHEGDCNFRVVKQHELTHVSNAREPMYAALPAFRQAVAQALEDPAFPMWGPSEEMAKEMAMGQISRHTKPVVDAFRAESQRRDTQLDSYQSLKGTQAMCSGW
jgi:hypothetical protein